MGRVGPVPVLCGSLWDSREEALGTPMASLDLAVCCSCAHVWNTAFDPAMVDYDVKYDNALDFSPTFRRYSSELVDHLVETFDLRGKRIAEIGSGKGEFLRQLCAAGDNKGLGYDPTYEGPEHDRGIYFVREFFTPDASPGPVDFVCCRHVLEHLADPIAFLLEVRAAVNDRPVPMYFEVPNGEFNFAESGPWDLIYPHVGYFNDESLRAVLTHAGFRVTSLGTAFNGQFLAAEVVPEPLSHQVEASSVPAGAGLAAALKKVMRRQLHETEAWRRRRGTLVESSRLAVWGAGSKGVAFLALVDPEGTIDTVVDANPRKWGRFLPGGGHEVVSPDKVTERAVETVLVMNPAYVEEISATIDALGATADVMVV